LDKSILKDNINKNEIKHEIKNEVNKKGQKLNRSNLKRLVNLAKAEYKLLLGSLAALVVSSASTLIFPSAMGKIIDIILDPSGVEKLIFVVEAMAVMSIIGGIASYYRILFTTKASERIVATLRRNLFEKLLSHDMSFFDNRKTGELINRLANDTNVMSKVFVDNLSYGLRRLVEGLGGLGVIMYLSPSLTLTMLLVFPPVFVGAVTYGRKLRKISTEVTDALADSTTRAEERLSSVKTVKAFVQERNEVEKYGDLVNVVYERAIRAGRYSGLFHGITFFAVNCALLAVLYKGGMQIINGHITPGELTSFLFYSLYVGFAFSGVSSFWAQLQQALGSSERVFELLDSEIHIKGDTTISKNVNGHIKYQNVSFNYPTRKNEVVLSDLNLEIEPGKSVAIVGYSGSGKSTIASLLFRFYDVDSGSVFIDDLDIKNIDPKSLRKIISYVPQDISLFGGSIAQNIAYSNPSATTEEIINAAKQANAHDFITKFNSGYETEVGEKGTQLSGGQKQRIAIARAILADPKILVLDEATSSLDVESEYLINQALERLMVNRTVMVIAHRLSTIRNADKIGVLHQGKLVELGTYDELLKVNGIFKQLVDKQLQ
jgi:ATP-binding cassette subfamily B protein